MFLNGDLIVVARLTMVRTSVATSLCTVTSGQFFYAQLHAAEE
jgi:hypothetical protein